MVAWILSMMLLCAPAGVNTSRFWEVAEAIDVASHETPLYQTDDGVERTAAELVALAYYESRFDPMAVASDWAGFSWGLFQEHETNFPRLGITWRDAVTPLPAARAALVLLAESHRICRGRPLEEQLSEYASGRGTCSTPEGLRDSRVRMRLAASLLRRQPAYWVDATR